MGNLQRRVARVIFNPCRRERAGARADDREGLVGYAG